MPRLLRSYLVGAWAVSAKLSLGCMAVTKKSNEITAIPELLTMLELVGTIDAMGCQTKIAKAVIQGGGDYILAVKGNQETLYEGIEDFFLDYMNDEFARTEVSRHETTEYGHGRREDAGLAPPKCLNCRKAFVASGMRRTTPSSVATSKSSVLTSSLTT